jgi:hypothetical protein
MSPPELGVLPEVADPGPLPETLPQLINTTAAKPVKKSLFIFLCF